MAICQTVAVAAEDRTGEVVRITDGDTFTVLVDRTPTKVRLAEINTPEKGQPRANRTKKALSEKVFGKVLEPEVVDLTATAARSPRPSSTAGTSIARWCARATAWAFRQYRRGPILLEDEQKARAAKLGLWALPEAQRVPPWEWRQGGS